MVQRGGIGKEDAKAVVDLSQVWAAHPRVRKRRSLFLTTVELMNDIRRLFKPRWFGFLYENVVMQPSMAQKVTNALDV